MHKLLHIKYTPVLNAIIYSKFRILFNFKQQSIVGRQYFNVPSPFYGVRRIVKISAKIWVVYGERPTQ